MSSLDPSSLSDAEWDRLQELLPIRSPYSRLRRHTLRSVFDAVFNLLRTGCPWRYGALSPATFRHGRPCTSISSSFAAPASGRACTERCETLNVRASA